MPVDKDYQDYLAYVAEMQKANANQQISPQGTSLLKIPTSGSEQEARLKQDLPLETPAIDPIDFAVPTGAGALTKGASRMIGVGDKAMRRGVTGLADFIGGKLAKLSPAQTEAYSNAPRTIEALLKAPELRQSQFAEQALNSASKRLGNRAGQLEETLQGQFAGKTVPENSIMAADQFRPRTANLMTQEVPVSDVYAGAREAGKAAKFSPNPIDPLAEKARAEAAGQEFSTLRGAVSNTVPEAEPTIEALKQGIEAQQGLKGGANRPIGFFESQTPDNAAARQAADKLVDSTRLQRTSDQLSAAKALGTAPKSLHKAVLKAAGHGILRGSAAIGDVGQAISSGLGRGLEAIPDRVLSGPATHTAASGLENYIGAASDPDAEDYKAYQAYLQQQGH